VQKNNAFQAWREERDTVEAEMNALFGVGLLVAPEERQVRKLRFMALLQRREAAADELLKHARQSRSQHRARMSPAARETTDANRDFKSDTVSRSRRSARADV